MYYNVLMVVQFDSGVYEWVQGMPLFQEACVHIVTILSLAKGNSKLLKGVCNFGGQWDSHGMTHLCGSPIGESSSCRWRWKAQQRPDSSMWWWGVWEDYEIDGNNILEDFYYPTNVHIGEYLHSRRKRRIGEPFGGDKMNKISPGFCRFLSKKHFI